METIKKFKSAFLNLNQKGGAIILAMGIASIGIIGLLAAQMVSQNLFNDIRTQKTADERARISASIQGLLNDQNFCNQFFAGGFNNTTAGTYNFLDSGSPIVTSALANLDNQFKSYRPGEVLLSNETALKPDTTGVQYKSFDITVAVVPKAEGMGIIGGSFGANTNKNSTNLKLVLSNNGKCYLDNYASATNDTIGIESSCAALGGIYEDGRCFVKQYSTPFDGYVDTSATVLNQGTFADALCEMELSALRKMGPHLINQSSSNSRAFGWTSFCAKPKWAGCRASNSVDILASQGNDPNSSDLKLPGDEWKADKVTMKAKRFDKYLARIAQPTIMRRVNRVSGIVTAEEGQDTVSAALSKYKYNYAEVAGVLGLGTSGALGATAAFTFFGTLAWAGPVGIAVAAVLAILAPKCDKLRAEVNFQCTEGFSEIVKVDYETQKLSISFSGIKCKWRRGGTVKLPTDSELYALLKSKGSITDYMLDLSSDTAAMDDVSDVLAQLENPDLTFEDIINLFSEETSEDPEDGALQIPNSLLSAVLAKEMALWAKFSAEVSTQTASITSAPRSRDVGESDAAYTDYLTVEYNRRAERLDTLSERAKRYIEFSKSVKNLDGSPRVLTSTEVYATYISPTVSRIRSAASELKSEAASHGVIITTADSMLSAL